jgi:adenine/guanine phosphoribosyltransferase-like PRPP-binding protein
LIRQLGGEIAEMAVLVELASLKGRDKLNGCPLHAMITYP